MSDQAAGRRHPAVPTQQPPAVTERLTPRAREIAACARELLEAEGAARLSMRNLASRLSMRAPSLYKHFASKDAIEAVLTLAPETNGEVAVKAWEALGKVTGREHAHLAVPKEDEKIRYRDIQAQPRKIISSPTWSGIESERVCYNAGWTNVHELIPWRTLTGR